MGNPSGANGQGEGAGGGRRDGRQARRDPEEARRGPGDAGDGRPSGGGLRRDRGRRRGRRLGVGEVSLERALSKLGLATRGEARQLVLEGRVSVDRRTAVDPLAPVVPERIRLAIDGRAAVRPAPCTVLLHKPRGHVTTRRDPQGRPTVYECVAACGTHLVAVGRLDAATSGLLLLTNDTRFADWVTDPAHGVPRIYLATVRGELSDETAARLTAGVEAPRWRSGAAAAPERLAADLVTVRKRSHRETHLMIRLSEGRNREVRRLLAAVGHEVTALKRVSFGGLDLGHLAPGHWRPLTAAELRAAFPGAPLRDP